MSSYGDKYYFKLGDKSPIILGLKKFLDTQVYLKIKNTSTYIFDAEFQTSLVKFQSYYKLIQQDGLLDAETYAKLGKVMHETDIDRISLRDPILKKLLLGIGLIPERFKIEKGVPVLINNNETPAYPVFGKTIIVPSNGNAADIATDEKLAILFGDEKQKPVVNGANQRREGNTDLHYVLDNGLVYVIHVFGPTGNEFIDIYSPAEFGKPVLSANATPKANGFFGLVCTNKKLEVLRFAHVDSIQSQSDLDRAWNAKMTNSVGSRYIGTIGLSGGGPGFMHSHIGYFKNLQAMNIIRARKIGLNEVYDPKYYIDFKTLVAG